MGRCDCCGKFRKNEDLSGTSGDANDLGDSEEWVECIYCMSGFDLERHNNAKEYWKEQEAQNGQNSKL